LGNGLLTLSFRRFLFVIKFDEADPLQMMSFFKRGPFKLRKTFTSSLSAEEAINNLGQLLNTKSKFLFFSFNGHVGSIKGNSFTLGRHIGDPFGLFSPKIKGIIRGENPTIIDTRIGVPYSFIIFYFFFQMIGLPIIFSADEMTFNGVPRVPDVYDKIGVALLIICIPALAIFFIIILPIKQIEGRLTQVLKLKEKQSAK
jgi:hypothetical protein